jgi:CRP-like cAMP-binding protein
MIATAQKASATPSRLLSAVSVSPAELLSYAREIKITVGQTLYDGHTSISHCIFPETSLMSLMSCTEHGASVAVGMVGSEGMLGIAALFDEQLLPYRTIAQSPGTALRLPAAKLREWLRHDLVLRNCIIHFLHAMFTQVVQTAACNRFHVTEQRLARWLLLAHDRLNVDKMPFTHESLAAVLGTDRVSITRSAKKLKSQGLLNYTRGKSAILDRQGLLSVCCECYLTIKKEYDALAELCSRKKAI